MFRSPFRGQSKLIYLLVMAGALVAVAAMYIICLIAIHVSVALSSASVSTSSRATNPRSDGFVAGLLAAVMWTLLMIVLAIVLFGDGSAWIAGGVVGVPVGLVVGWQVSGWQEARSWSRFPGAAVIGDWRTRLFKVSRPYTVTPGERMKHIVCSGATGSGKTTLATNLIVEDIRSGAGVCVIDPKDDLVNRILPHIPPERTDDVIVLDATDLEAPLGLNPLAGVPESQRSLMASQLISVFRRYFADAWGARLEHVLRNVILALLEVPGATLVDIPRLLMDESFLRRVADQVTNPAVREFLLVEYERVLKRRSDAIEPILNKVGPWLSYPELRNIIGQEKPAFDFRRVMDEGQILLVRIPQGAFGEDVSNLLGALVVAKIQLAAQSRVDVHPSYRRPFILYVDEFQNFATSSFTKILTEARAFGLGLVCVNQYPEQLSRELQQALVRNAATFIACTYRRGEYIAEVTRQEDLGEKKVPVYSVRPPAPLPPGDEQRSALIREASRRRYASVPASIGTHEPGRSLTLQSAPDGQRWGTDCDEE